MGRDPNDLTDDGIEVGVRVRYRRTFLQSIGWLLDVPRDGIVREVPEGARRRGSFVTVEWCTGQRTKILRSNIIPADRWEPN
jgi:hypothetical protein